MIKATYSLDPDTARALEAMARRLGVSKSEALRRAIHLAAGTGERGERLAALDQLQKLMALTPDAAAAWTRSVRAERRAGGRVRGVRAATAHDAARDAEHNDAPAAAPRALRVAESAPKRRP